MQPIAAVTLLLEGPDARKAGATLGYKACTRAGLVTRASQFLTDVGLGSLATRLVNARSALASIRLGFILGSPGLLCCMKSPILWKMTPES